MLWFSQPRKTYRAKPPVVEAYQFINEEDCQAQYWAEQYGACSYFAARYTSESTFHFEHDKNMDWVDSTIYRDGKKIKHSQKPVEIPVGWWIVINDAEDTVEFIPDHKFKARYEETA